MVSTRVFVPQGHPTITTRFTQEELASVGVEIVNDAQSAQVIVAALVEELLPHMQRFRNERRFLVWCDEPLWSMIFQKVDTTRTAFLLPAQAGDGGSYVTVDAMNCFTGNVLFSNYHFLQDIYHLDSAALRRAQGSNSGPLPPAGERRIAAFLTYRNGGIWNFRHPCGIHGLNTLRSRVALEGRLFGQVDVYGQGWPMQLALQEDAPAEGEDLFWQKIRQYGRYKFALCMENTWAPYYVTEKIWQAILGGCLPIYYAGPQHTIYQDLPQGSFIDCADYEHPADLFDGVNRLTQEEFDRRMALCQGALATAIGLSRDGQVPRTQQLSWFAQRVAVMAAGG